MASLLHQTLTVQISPVSDRNLLCSWKGRTWITVTIDCHFICRFSKVDRNFNLIFNKEEKHETFQTLNFYNAVLNYAVISQLFISKPLCYSHAFKSMQNGPVHGRAVSTHFHQNCLRQEIVIQCQFCLSFYKFEIALISISCVASKNSFLSQTVRCSHGSFLLSSTFWVLQLVDVCVANKDFNKKMYQTFRNILWSSSGSVEIVA